MYYDWLALCKEEYLSIIRNWHSHLEHDELSRSLRMRPIILATQCSHPSQTNLSTIPKATYKRSCDGQRSMDSGKETPPRSRHSPDRFCKIKSRCYS